MFDIHKFDFTDIIDNSCLLQIVCSNVFSHKQTTVDDSIDFI